MTLALLLKHVLAEADDLVEGFTVRNHLSEIVRRHLDIYRYL